MRVHRQKENNRTQLQTRQKADKNVENMESYENSLLQSKRDTIPQLRRQRNKSLQRVE